MVRFFIILILLSTFFLVTKSEINSEINIAISPKNPFCGDIIRLNVSCPKDFVLDYNGIKVIRPDNSERIFPIGPFHQNYSLLIYPRDYIYNEDCYSGYFNISVICRKGDREEKSENISVFSVFLNHLEFELLGIENNYTNELTVVGLRISLNGSPIESNELFFDFSLTRNFSIEKKDDYYKILFIQRERFEGDVNITIFLRNFNRSFSKKFKLVISNPLSVSLLAQEKIYLSGENVIFPLTIKFKGNVILENFNLRVYGATLNNYFRCEDKICINLTLPKEHTILKVVVFYDGYVSEDIKEIKIGKVGVSNFFNYNNEPIGVIMQIDNEIFYLSGNQTFLFLPGIRNITLKYGEIELKLFNVNLQDFDKSIRFYPLSLNERNLKILSFYVFETNLRFEKALARIFYDERKINIEENVELIVCRELSFSERSCKLWDREKFSRNSVSNYIEFELNSTEFFGLYEKKKLYLQYSLEKSNFYFDENFFIRGIVTDDENKNPDVEIGLVFLNKTYKTKSKNGFFEIFLQAPAFEGRYGIEIYSLSDLYVNFREKIEITVSPRIELNLITNTLKTNVSFVFLEVKNIGQKSLENVEVICENCRVKPDRISFWDKERVIRFLVSNFSNNSNPEIVKINFKYKDSIIASFEVPIYFENYESEYIEKGNNLPTSFFILVPDINSLATISTGILILLISLLLIKEKKTKPRLAGKLLLKRKIK